MCVCAVHNSLPIITFYMWPFHLIFWSITSCAIRLLITSSFYNWLEIFEAFYAAICFKVPLWVHFESFTYVVRIDLYGMVEHLAISRSLPNTHPLKHKTWSETFVCNFRDLSPSSPVINPEEYSMFCFPYLQWSMA